MSDAVKQFDLARGRLSFALAILHTCDLDGLARNHERLTSPQALIEGVRPSDQQNADYWLAVISSARKLRDLAPFQNDVLASVEERLPAELKEEGAE